MVEQPGDYLRNHPHFIQGRAYEREVILELVEAAHPKSHKGSPRELCSVCVLIEQIGSRS
jgi:hypothetical protein